MAKKRKHAVKRGPRTRAVTAALPEADRASVPAVEQARPSLRAGVRFLVISVALMGLLYSVYYFPYAADSWPARVLESLLNAQGHAAAWLIGLFEEGVSAHEGIIQGRFPMRVVKACSSLDAQALFAGTVLAFPTGFRAKLLGLAVGACALTPPWQQKALHFAYEGLVTPLGNKLILPLIIGAVLFLWQGQQSPRAVESG